MNKLSKSWTFLFILGIIALVGSIVFRYIQSTETIEEAFTEEVVQFDQPRLFIGEVEDHMRNAPDFRTEQ